MFTLVSNIIIRAKNPGKESTQKTQKQEQFDNKV